MDDQKSIFSPEERVLEQAQRALNDVRYQQPPLLAEFAALFESYQRLYKQLRRLINRKRHV